MTILDPGVASLQKYLQQDAAPLGRPWEDRARPKQLPPDHQRHHEADSRGFRCGCGGDPGWHRWFFMAGRGTGKTLAGSNWIIGQAMKYPGSRWAAVAPTFNDCRRICFEGSTGIQRQLQPGELKTLKQRTGYKRNELVCELSNGSIIFGFSAQEPARIRGENLWGAWCDELCSWEYPEAWHEGLVMATRERESDIRIMITTTPRPTSLILELIKDEGVHVTTASIWENEDNLAPAFLEEMRRKYEGTRLGRQELEGELLEDMPGALWHRADIDAARVREEDVPPLDDIVVAIDPAQSSGENADETGIMVVGKAGAHGYVLADYTMRGSPEEVMRKAVAAVHTHGATRITAEKTMGGDWLLTALRHVDAHVPYHAVNATKGKAIRAQGASMLAEQHRLHHAGVFEKLENQLCLFVPDNYKGHDDRLDALVWAVEDLKLSGGSMLDAYGHKRCPECEGVYRDVCPQCPKCHPGTQAVPAPPPEAPQRSSGGWMAVNGLVYCEKGHAYPQKAGKCSRCAQAPLDYIRKLGQPGQDGLSGLPGFGGPGGMGAFR